MSDKKTSKLVANSRRMHLFFPGKSRLIKYIHPQNWHGPKLVVCRCFSVSKEAFSDSIVVFRFSGNLTRLFGQGFFSRKSRNFRNSSLSAREFLQELLVLDIWPVILLSLGSYNIFSRKVSWGVKRPWFQKSWALIFLEVLDFQALYFIITRLLWYITDWPASFSRFYLSRIETSK